MLFWRQFVEVSFLEAASMMNILRGAGYLVYGTGVFLKNVVWFVLMPWTMSRRLLGDRADDRYCIAILYSFVSAIIIGATIGVSHDHHIPFTHSWLFNVWYITLPVVAGNILSSLYELGWAFSPPAAEAVPPVAPVPDDQDDVLRIDGDGVSNSSKKFYEREMDALRQDLGKSISRRNRVIGGILTITALLGLATGWMLHKNILTVRFDGVTMAQELENAKGELEKLKSGLMEKAKEMAPPGILPPDKDKKDDDF